MSLLSQIMNKVVEIHREHNVYPDELELLVNRETHHELMADATAACLISRMKNPDDSDTINGVTITFRKMLPGQCPVWVLRLKGDEQKCFAFSPERVQL